jgi:hypothetical protein
MKCPYCGPVPVPKSHLQLSDLAAALLAYSNAMFGM